jgi:hypothetical protein
MVPLVCTRDSQMHENELEWTVPNAGVETGPARRCVVITTLRPRFARDLVGVLVHRAGPAFSQPHTTAGRYSPAMRRPDRGQRGEAAEAVAEGAARIQSKIEQINGGKGDHGSGNPEPKHITNIVPGYALTSFHFG